MDILWLALIGCVGFSLASIAQAATGFGYALVAVPAFSLFVDVPTAVVAATGLGFLLTAGTGFSERQHVDRGPAVRMFLASLVGMPVGLYLLSVLDERLLSVIVALSVLAMLPLLGRGRSCRCGRGLEYGSGALSGMMITSTGMNGPPLVMALQSLAHAPRTFRATLQAVFSGQDLIALIAFGFAGYLNRDAGILIASGALGIPLGWRVGDWLLGLMTAGHFRRLVFAALVLSATALLGQGLWP